MNASSSTSADHLHRLVKQAIDSGLARTIEEAEALFRGYRLCIDIGPAESCEPAHQASLLTAVALGSRVFLGGVTVVGALDVPLRCPLPLGGTLREAVVGVGGSTADTVPPGTPRITIGGGQVARGAEFHVRTVYGGWRAGVVPAHGASALDDRAPMALAPMLSSALAVSEAYHHVSGEVAAAGRRGVGLSLWQPQLDWLEPDGAPPLDLLPSRLWLIGLGHLGQAYLWALGLLPYKQPAGLELVLQDFDVITPSTQSTSILTSASMVGQRKTRAMATWAEARGFTTILNERRFDDSFTRAESEPAIALCGLDNALGRRALDQVGFKMVVEAGLGSGHRDFRTMRLHTLPGKRPAAELWKSSPAGEPVAKQPAYEHLLANGGLDQCGVTLLAGKAVGAPFVGATAACLAVSEILRLLNDGPSAATIDLDLASIEHRTVIARDSSFGAFNPGFIRATGPARVATGVVSV